PMSHTDDEGVIRAVLDPNAVVKLDEAAFQRMEPGTPLFIGAARPVIERLAARYRVRLIRLAEQDEIAILNSIPTAEGAIWRAMAERETTIHGSACAVLGFGRCGVTLARMLHCLGADVTVAARNPAQLARAYEMGIGAIALHDLGALLPSVDIVFNTIPAMVLTPPLLSRLPAGALVIDIATAPGGTDFAAAAKLGVRAFLELGIPGRIAPRTAGEILARTVPRLIAEALTRGRDR
ncbi:MAG TPA: dipicolinate synthase subunit DpsA, partial [Limnochordia bacterium]